MSIEDASKSIKGEGGGLKNKLFFFQLDAVHFDHLRFSATLRRYLRET